MSLSITRENFDEWMMPVYAPAAFIPVRGEGSRLWDQQGKEYIDFAGGLRLTRWAMHTPALRPGVKRPGGEVLAYRERLYQRTGAASGEKTDRRDVCGESLFLQLGAEANEAALKLARKYAHDKFGVHKSGIVAFKNAFHGPHALYRQRRGAAVLLAGLCAAAAGYPPRGV
ncbi:bifunctional succinylornithine transaminase/acetylornithine transaminase [Enterobacter cloacae]|uniref:Bifunctional succinylornithine transaminase/acetylornithine transaminase n=1 Tax=Enterobacter cloacae TaxID=550 RepID=A0A377M390_ENTCL|nr:bifunctional succinylornithine transaminase/acetylornithine transaminase [Enterobacter cloacae]